MDTNTVVKLTTEVDKHKKNKKKKRETRVISSYFYKPIISEPVFINSLDEPLCGRLTTNTSLLLSCNDRTNQENEFQTKGDGIQEEEDNDSLKKSSDSLQKCSDTDLEEPSYYMSMDLPTQSVHRSYTFCVAPSKPYSVEEGAESDSTLLHWDEARLRSSYIKSKSVPTGLCSPIRNTEEVEFRNESYLTHSQSKIKGHRMSSVAKMRTSFAEIPPSPLIFMPLNEYLRNVDPHDSLTVTEASEDLFKEAWWRSSTSLDSDSFLESNPEHPLRLMRNSMVRSSSCDSSIYVHMEVAPAPSPSRPPSVCEGRGRSTSMPNVFGHNTRDSFTDPMNLNDTFLVISAVAGIIAVILIIVLIVLCYRFKIRCRKRKSKDESGIPRRVVVTDDNTENDKGLMPEQRLSKEEHLLPSDVSDHSTLHETEGLLADTKKDEVAPADSLKEPNQDEAEFDTETVVQIENMQGNSSANNLQVSPYISMDRPIGSRKCHTFCGAPDKPYLIDNFDEEPHPLPPEGSPDPDVSDPTNNIRPVPVSRARTRENTKDESTELQEKARTMGYVPIPKQRTVLGEGKHFPANLNRKVWTDELYMDDESRSESYEDMQMLSLLRLTRSIGTDSVRCHHLEDFTIRPSSSASHFNV